MKNQSLAANIMKISIEDSIHKVMDIIEKEDGRTFEEKKKEAINFLKDKENTLLAERLIDIATNDEMGKKIYKKFWAMGECIITENEIILRKVQDSDKHIFIELQKENNIVKSMMKEEAYRNMLWNEHIEYKALMFSVIVDNEYAGYCGIKNTTHEQWEIAIEICISEFLLHEEADIRRCEEENIHLLDERIQKLAKQFNVEPRKLLSHVLEYKLTWH